jgi:hypothetical protein
MMKYVALQTAAALKLISTSCNLIKVLWIWNAKKEVTVLWLKMLYILWNRESNSCCLREIGNNKATILPSCDDGWCKAEGFLTTHLQS